MKYFYVANTLALGISALDFSQLREDYSDKKPQSFVVDPKDLSYETENYGGVLEGDACTYSEQCDNYPYYLCKATTSKSATAKETC
jgi:hypothetical protein